MTLDFTTITAEDFEAYVGQTFTARTAQGPIELTLDNVKRGNPNHKRTIPLEIEGVVYPPREPFSLTFEGPLNPVLTTMSYPLDNELTGEIELFLSAFGQEQDCTLYNVVFT